MGDRPFACCSTPALQCLSSQTFWCAWDAGYLPARVDHSLFFLQTTLNETQPGYGLLDTGATYSAVGPVAACVSRNYWNPSSNIALRGGTGDTRASVSAAVRTSFPQTRPWWWISRTSPATISFRSPAFLGIPLSALRSSP